MPNPHFLLTLQVPKSKRKLKRKKVLLPRSLSQQKPRCCLCALSLFRVLFSVWLCGDFSILFQARAKKKEKDKKGGEADEMEMEEKSESKKEAQDATMTDAAGAGAASGTTVTSPPPAAAAASSSSASSTSASPATEKKEEKKDEKKEESKEDGKEQKKEEKKEEPEPDCETLLNPARVTRSQIKVLSCPPNQRYLPVKQACRTIFCSSLRVLSVLFVIVSFFFFASATGRDTIAPGHSS